MLVLELFALDANTGFTERLSFFQPTPEFLSILPYFDQYHRSATIWSPDSRNIVFTTLQGGQARNVMVVSASGGLEPRNIASGSLAFWSWQ